MARLPAVTREQLDPEDHQYFDAIVGTRGSIRGPTEYCCTVPSWPPA